MRASRQSYSRSQRVAEMIQRELGMYFIKGSCKDIRLENKYITVTYIRLSDDLKHAKVFIRILGDEGVEASCLEALNENAYKIKKNIARKLKLRFTPSMSFAEDIDFIKNQKLFELIEDVTSEGGAS